MSHQKQNLLTLKEMADYLAVSSRTLLTHVEKLEIPYFRIGGRPRFDRDTVLSYFRAEPLKPIAKQPAPKSKERTGRFVGILG